MVAAHIYDGDIVVLEPGRARHRDIVAVVHEGSLLLKRLVIVEGVPFLKGENPVQTGMVRAIDKPVHGIFRGLLRFGRVPMEINKRHKPGVEYALPSSEPVLTDTQARRSHGGGKLSTRRRAERR